MTYNQSEHALERGLHVIERINDPELTAAYRQYMERVEALVGRDQVDAYTALYQRDRRQLTHQALGSTLSPEEQAVRAKVSADPELGQLYDRYIALAAAHGILDPRVEQGHAEAEELSDS
jgi:hypothetical protein